MTPRKTRLWVTTNIALSVSAAGIAGQGIDATMGTDFEAKSGRTMTKGDTLAHTWVKGAWSQSSTGDTTIETVAFGIMFAPEAMDSIDFPLMIDHSGDLQLHDSRSLRENNGVAADFMRPVQLAIIDIESAGQRSVPFAGVDVGLFVIGGTQTTPSAGNFTLEVAVTALWLLH